VALDERGDEPIAPDIHLKKPKKLFLYYVGK
jgi:hypothetical protein